MSIFDLLFLCCALAFVLAVLRVLYLVVRGPAPQALRVLKRLGVAVVVYIAVLLGVSLTAPGVALAAGTPQCFDDFCVIVDSATRAPSSPDVVLVHGRLSSRARRRQRETDIYGRLSDAQGRTYVTSARDSALASSANLRSFVEPMGEVPFTLPFRVAGDASQLVFAVRHGWFPGALIIASPESFLHRATTVALRVR
jgi:hypothetical protein